MNSWSLFFTLISAALFSFLPPKKEPQWKTTLKTMPIQDKQALEVFFRILLKDTSGGYVIFGEKPIAIESISEKEHKGEYCNYLCFDSFHKTHIGLKKGYDIWKKLPLKSSNYLISLSNKPMNGSFELILVNKRYTKKELSKHQVLFKYVLGPQVDSENFLQTLENSGESLYSILKNDRVLVGILLGYGAENALKQSRREYINESLWDFEQVLPLRSGTVKSELMKGKKSLEKEETFFCRKRGGIPSFAFSTLMEEKNWLEENHQLSLKKAFSKKFYFPWFGYWESKESEQILNHYYKAQVKLENILQSNYFLEKVFEQLFSG